MTRPPTDPNPKPSTGGVADATGAAIFTGDWNALIADYLSQTDTTYQSTKSIVEHILASPTSTSDIAEWSIVKGKYLARMDYLGNLYGALPDTPVVTQNTLSADNNFVANGGPGPTVTVTVNTTIEHWIIVGVQIVDPNTVTSVTDTIGNVYGAAKVTRDDLSQTVYLYTVASKATNATNVITVNISGAGAAEAQVFAFSVNGPILIGNTASASGAIFTNPSVTVTTQDANNMVVAVIGHYFDSGDSWTAQNGTIVGTRDDLTLLFGGIVRNSSTTAGNVTCSVLSTLQGQWAALGIELRSVLPGGSVLRTDIKIKFVDQYGTGYWLPPDPVIYDANSNNRYDAGDTVIYGTPPALNTTITLGNARLKYYSINAVTPSTWVLNDPVVYDGNANFVYDTTPILPITGALTVTGNLTTQGVLTANGVGLHTLGGDALVKGRLEVGGATTTSQSVFVTTSPGFFATMYGLLFTPNIVLTGQTGNLLRAIGGEAVLLNSSGNSTQSFTGFHSQLGFQFVAGSLTVPVLRGLHNDIIARVGAAGTITVTDWYGVDLEDSRNQVVATITNPHGIYQRGPNDENRLRAPVRTGDVTNPAKLGLEAFGGFGEKVLSQSANYTMLPSDNIILATGGAGGITITLPAANAGGSNIGQKIVVVKSDTGAGAITVAGAGTDTIQGSVSLSLLAQYNKAVLVSDNISRWYDLGAGLV